MKKVNIKTKLLTDTLIQKYSDDRIVKNKGDINLKVDKYFDPVPEGLYDSHYFGSVYSDSCNCKLVRKQNVYCHNCGSTPLDEATRNSRFARIESPFYYSPYFKMKSLQDFILENFKIVYKLNKLTSIEGRGKLTRALDLCTIEIKIDEKYNKPVLIFGDNYKTIKKVSFEGLLSELTREGLTAESETIKKYIDKNIIVTPASMRGINITTIKGKRDLVFPRSTSIYKSIILAKTRLVKVLKEGKLSEEEKAMIIGVYRAYLRKSLLELSEFSKTSKENLARKMYSARINNSSRSVITAGPHLRVDTISLPLQNAYAMLKERFVTHLMEKNSINYMKALKMYNRGSDKLLEYFEKWIKISNPTVIMVRQPTLHKYSMMSFKIQIHKGHDLKIPLEVCGPFGGDFDGDEMGVFLVPEDTEEEVFKKMNPISLKFYDKNLKPIIMPSHGVLHGYIICSQVDFNIKPEGGKRIIVDDIEELEKLYTEEKVRLKEIVYMDGNRTTFGRAKMESILGDSLNNILGTVDDNSFATINSKNIEDLMRFIYHQKDPAGIVKDLREFVLDMSTVEGFSSLSLDQIYQGMPYKFTEELERIKENPNLTSIQKFIRINIVEKEMKEYIEDNMDPNLKQTMINSNRMKISSLLEVVLPRTTVDDDGNLLTNERSLFEGLSEEEYSAHALQNRMILNLKQVLVPRSGSLTRQMAFLAQSFEYHKELKDKNNPGILLPHYKCEGRTTVDGKIVRKSNSKKLIRVKSIAVSDKNYVCPETISKTVFPPDETSRAWGLRAATSLTEQMTQAGLSLKHSGSFVQLANKNRLIQYSDWPGSIIVDDEKSKIEVIKDGENKMDIFPLPDNFDIINKKVNSKGDLIGSSLEISSAGLNLDVMIKILKATKAKHDEGLAKNNIIMSNSYSPISGIINYNFDKGTYKIGDINMGKIDPIAVFYFPQGSKIKKYDKVQSHPVNLKWYFDNKIPLEDIYQIFRKDFTYYAGRELTEELIETLFHLIIKKDKKNGNEFLGVKKGITRGNNSFFAQVSFERAKSALSRLSSGELKFESDMFTRNILDHMIITAK